MDKLSGFELNHYIETLSNLDVPLDIKGRQEILKKLGRAGESKVLIKFKDLPIYRLRMEVSNADNDIVLESLPVDNAKELIVNKLTEEDAAFQKQVQESLEDKQGKPHSPNPLPPGKLADEIWALASSERLEMLRDSVGISREEALGKMNKDPLYEVLTKKLIAEASAQRLKVILNYESENGRMVDPEAADLKRQILELSSKAKTEVMNEHFAFEV